jgi:hypothetical protein
MRYFFASRFFIGFCLLLSFSLWGFCERIPGTLSHLSLFHTHLQWELFVDEKDLPKICGIRDKNFATATLDKERIAKHLNSHIRLQTNDGVLEGNLIQLRKQAPSYWVLTLDYPFLKEPKHFEAEYHFSNTFDGSDRTALVFYDQRGGKKDLWITLLHDSRKRMHWTPEGLENILLKDSHPEFPWIETTTLLGLLWFYLLGGGRLLRRSVHDFD